MDFINNNDVGFWESPIEKELYYLLLNSISGRNYAVFIKPQAKMLLPYRKGIFEVRVDILLTVDYHSTNIKIAIECDGHEFHEKTKEQVEKNNRRDRVLKFNDIEPYHCSGSELYNYPVSCVNGIWDFVQLCIDRIENIRNSILDENDEDRRNLGS